MLSLILLFMVSFTVTVLIAVGFYKLGRKHSIVIGRAQLVKEIIIQQEQQMYEDFIDSCKEEFENWD